MFFPHRGGGSRKRYAPCHCDRYFFQDLSAFNPANAFKGEEAGDKNGEKTSNGVQAEVSGERREREREMSCTGQGENAHRECLPKPPARWRQLTARNDEDDESSMHGY